MNMKVQTLFPGDIEVRDNVTTSKTLEVNEINLTSLGPGKVTYKFPEDLLNYCPENIDFIGESQILILKKFWDFLEGNISIVVTVSLKELGDLFEHSHESTFTDLKIKLSKEINSINFITDVPFKCSLYHNDKRIKMTEGIAKIFNKAIFPQVYKKFVLDSFKTRMTSQIENYFEIKVLQA